MRTSEDGGARAEVTVVIPCFRQAPLLPEAVGSVEAQTFRSWEIVVVDDGSPDETAAVATRLAEQLGGRLRLVRQPNRGVAAARNRGIAEARTPLILPLDADDQLAPDFLEATVGALRAAPSASVAFTDVATFGGVEGTFPPRGPLEASALAEENRLAYASLYRRTAWFEAGGYNPVMVPGYEDWDFWIALARRGVTGVHVPRPLLRYRVTGRGLAARALEQHGRLRARMMLNHPGLFPPAWVEAARAHLSAGGATPARAPAPAARQAGLVTIFMPVFNGARYVVETIESILAQTYRHLELLVCDDGSTDGTPELVAGLAARDGRIRLLRLAHGGEVAARNAALAAARPETAYFLNHDADDLSLPGKLEALVRRLEAEPGLHLVGCRAVYFDDSGAQRGEPPIAVEADQLRATFGRVNSLIHSATLMRREVVERLGGYREAFRSVDDYDLFARALMAGFRACNLPEVLHRIRLHPGSVSATRAETQARLAAEIQRRYQGWLATGVVEPG